MIITEQLQRFIEDAKEGKSTLPDDIANMVGESSPRVRRLLNALCSQPGAAYLEIGVNGGSTFIPAVYGNEARATCIDHWKMFEGSRELFDLNVRQYIPERKINVIEADCFTVDLVRIPQGVNVYFYDGAHDAEAQYKALTYFAPVMADQFVLLVDDCNWEEPREETKKAIKDLGWRVIYDVLLPGAYNGDKIGWWNGLYVALIEKVSVRENLPTP
jgi:hypothetical protein